MTIPRLASLRPASSLTAALAGVLAGGTARAEVSAPPSIAIAAPAEPSDSINVSPLGLLFGSYAVTYEHLFAGHHGLLIEGAYSRQSDDDGSIQMYGGAIGYRWHWRGRQDSGFLGLTLDAYRGHGDVAVDVGDVEKSFDLTVRRTALTANVGKRWQWDSGVNLTLRFGAGVGRYSASSESDDPDVQEGVDAANDLLALLPVALDGELSLGYSF